MNKQELSSISSLSELESSKSSSSAHVRRLYTENNLFLDLSSLSKSF